jgi:hypothetical protein
MRDKRVRKIICRYKISRPNGQISNSQKNEGELAQLARATALHAVGQRFDSVILHKKRLRNVSSLKKYEINRYRGF